MLGRALAQVLRCEVNADSLSLQIKSQEQELLRADDLFKALETIGQPDFFSAERLTEMVRSLPRGR